MDNSKKTIIGIVVWQHKVSLACYIWCKETYVGNDGILYPNPENPVKVGDWVAITFTKTEYQQHFSDDKTVKLPKFEARNYVVLPAYLKTTAFGATVRVELEQALTENQHVMEHKFFGNIYNNKNLQFSSGTWNIIIKRVEPKSRDSVWVLEEVNSVQEPPKDTKIKKIDGIVVSRHLGTTYVWCKERPVSHDVTLKNSSDIPIGTWITFTVEKDIFEEAFSAAKGFVSKYEIEEYNIMEKPKHPTELTGMKQTTVNIKLEGHFERNVNVEDIWHPTVGLIINESFKFPVSGKYNFTVFRAKPKENPPRSVWFLKNPELVSEIPTKVPSQPVQQETTLERQLRYMSIDNLSTYQSSSSNQRPSRPVNQTRVSDDTQAMLGFNTRGSNQQASSLQVVPQRPSQPVDRFRTSDHIQSESGFSTSAVNQSSSSYQANHQISPQPVVQFQASHDTQSMHSFSKHQAAQQRPSRPVEQIRVADHAQPETPPVPAPRRFRSRSRPNRSESRQRRSVSRRRRSASRPRDPPVVKTAIIYKMMKFAQYEVIHVWLLDEQAPGKLKLDVAAEKHYLELGSVFDADFVWKGDTWISDEPENIKLNDKLDYKHETRGDGQHGIDIRVHSEVLKNAGVVGNKYPTIFHHHFGNIIDNFSRLKFHERTKYHMWIRRVNLDGKFEWVVTEQII